MIVFHDSLNYFTLLIVIVIITGSRIERVRKAIVDKIVRVVLFGRLITVFWPLRLGCSLTIVRLRFIMDVLLKGEFSPRTLRSSPIRKMEVKFSFVVYKVVNTVKLRSVKLNWVIRAS